MTTNRSGHRPGGGIASNKRVETKVRTGDGSHSTRPGYVSQLGNKVGDHTTDGPAKGTGYTGERMYDRRDFQPVPFGNEVALNSKSAPGQGRTIYASGSQGTQGPTAPGNPQPQQGDMLSSFGPERSR